MRLTPGSVHIAGIWEVFGELGSRCMGIRTVCDLS